MRDIILLLSEMMNQIHDAVMYGMGVNMTDKQMHFWVIGFIGLATFLVGYVVIKIIQQLKFNTTILSFLFTFILMTVFVFAIEIQQAVTNSGNMEFADAVAGLWGFIVFFLVYAIVAGFFYSIFRVLRRGRRKSRKRKVSKPYAGKRKKAATPVQEEPEPVVIIPEPEPVSEREPEPSPEEPIKYRSELRKQRENQ